MYKKPKLSWLIFITVLFLTVMPSYLYSQSNPKASSFISNNSEPVVNNLQPSQNLQSTLKFTVEPNVIKTEKGMNSLTLKIGLNSPCKVKIKLYSYSKEQLDKLNIKKEEMERFNLKYSIKSEKLNDSKWSNGITGLFEIAKLNLKLNFLSSITPEELKRREKNISEKLAVLKKEKENFEKKYSSFLENMKKEILVRDPSQEISIELQKSGDIVGPLNDSLTYIFKKVFREKNKKTKSDNIFYPFAVTISKLTSNRPYIIVVEASDGVKTISKKLEVTTNPVLKPYSLQVIIFGLVFIFLILISIKQAEKGKEFYIRNIAGLNAIEEAVGRATEMGKPVLYLTGLHDLQSIATLASISILSHVSKRTAEYETQIIAPHCRSIVMVTAREVVKESYISMGKADHYNEDDIVYLTDDQFGFTSGVDGIMVREKPAANFYLGHFMAESLIYAETGHSIGAIQVAGTEEFSQIPFFITACDYTLIGEELFAAGAYLSKQPRDVGSLRGQDIGKLIVILIILVGLFIESAGYITENTSLLSFADWFRCN